MKDAEGTSTIQISVCASYSFPNPPTAAVEESILSHMRAYGFTNVRLNFVLRTAES